MAWRTFSGSSAMINCLGYDTSTNIMKTSFLLVLHQPYGPLPSTARLQEVFSPFATIQTLREIYCFKELNRFCHCIVIQISFYENWLKYHLGVFQVLVWFAEHLALPSWYYNQPYLMIIWSLWHASPNCFVNKVKVFHVKQKTIFCKLVLFVLSKKESESFAQ